MVNRKVNVAQRLALVVAAALLACGGGQGASVTDASSSGSTGSSGSGGGGSAAQSVDVSVTPPSANLYVQQKLGFAAAVTGSSIAGVTWTIQEGSTGGNVTSDGVYTAPAAPGTYHVVATSAADTTKSASATVSVTTAPPVTGAPMTTATRTTGVAPLAVFFDAVDETAGTYPTTYAWTSGVYQPPDMEGAQWSWDFGDPGSGTWNTTGLSKNTATGYTAAHVFENPGTYNVSLTVTDTSGVVRSYVQTITVTAFSGTTRYLAAGGAGDGTSSSSPWGSWTTAMSWVNGGSNRRLLINRGDTFHVGGSTFSAAGPNVIGAYGTGARPVIYATATPFYFTGADWRLMDLDLHPEGAPGTTGSAFTAWTTAKNFLALRITSRDFMNSWTTADQGDAAEGLTIADSEDTNCTPNGIYGGIAAYIAGRHLAFLGNNIHDNAQIQYSSHNLRVCWAHHGVIAHNRLFNPGCNGGYPNACRHSLKLHSLGRTSYPGSPETNYVTITDNLMRGKAWAVAVAPQNPSEDERISHVVYERNHHYAEATVTIDLDISARDVMVRNNVFDNSGGYSSYTGVNVSQRGVEPPPDDVRILNNTFVRTDAFSSYQAVGLASVDTNVVVRNNLLTATSSPTGLLFNASGGYAQDHNWVGTLANALLTSPSTGNFTLVTGSPASGTGATLAEVREDFTRALRSSPPDIGAY